MSEDNLVCMECMRGFTIQYSKFNGVTLRIYEKKVPQFCPFCGQKLIDG